MSIKTLSTSLWRNPLVPVLLAAQVALGMMILANVAYVVSVRLDTTERPTGMDLDNIFWIRTQGEGKAYDPQSSVRLDLSFLNAIPGVVAASAASAIPQTGEAVETAVSADPEGATKRPVLLFQMTENPVDTLGLRLVDGRDYLQAAVVPAPSIASGPGIAFGPEVVITRALAEKMFADSRTAVGQTMYFALDKHRSATVVGVVERLQAAPLYLPDTDILNEIVLAPAVPAGPDVSYLVRTRPGFRDQVINRVVREFEPINRDRYLDKVETLAQTAAEARRADRASAVVLVILASFVLVITMIGLFGFASFAVTSRTKEIGTRRAIGATRADIGRQFLLENWLITSVGSVTGALLTLVFALQLSLMLELPRLPVIFLVGSMLLVWFSGLLAALLPAIRAASIPPAVATRAA